MKQITAMFTTLTEAGMSHERSDTEVSSLMDTWILLRMVESACERNRVLFVLKSRGMAHSNQMREFVLSDRGIELLDVYIGPGTVYTGTERMNQETRDRAAAQAARQLAAHRARELEHEQRTLEARIATLQAKLATTSAQHELALDEEMTRLKIAESHRAAMQKARETHSKGTQDGDR